MDSERGELLAKVARMYFLDGMTQLEISSQLGYSRSCISRFLTEAKDEGIVEIRIHDPLPRVYILEEELKSEFILKEVRVLESGNVAYMYALKKLGALASQLLTDNIRECQILGIAWGTSIYEMINSVRPMDCPWVKVVQLIGSAPAVGDHDDGPGLVRALAQKLNAAYFTLQAPWILGDRLLRDALMEDPRLRDVLYLTEHVDVAIDGIGVMDPEFSGLVRAGYLTGEEVNGLRAMGVVGEFSGLHFDLDGNLIDIPRMGYVFGIKPDSLKRVPLSVGIACSEKKAPAVLGAIRSGLINSLVVDNVVAKAVLKLAGL